MGAREQGAEATTDRWMTIPRTLCFVLNDDDVLLMKRAAHRRVFPNCYNGVGGHIERDEDPASCALREIREETGLKVRNLRLRGIHNIDAGVESGIMIFVFTAESVDRNFIDAEEEGTLHWIKIEDALDLDLVEDLPQVLPRVLNMADDDAPYFAHVSYDEQDNIRITFTET